MKTIRLFDLDSYIKSFEANVIEVNEVEGGFDVILDATAFFPEEGGQTCDTGFIGDHEVVDVSEKQGIIHHLCTTRPEIGPVACELDWDSRYSKMQNHTGEHIISGIVHALKGYDNTGFHLGEGYMTVDFSGELTDEEIRHCERAANEAIYLNNDVICSYPDEETLKTLDYRSKLEYMENIRIVNIKDIDICACCAPHVAKTGEVGVLKVVSSMRHRGGMRLTVVCGIVAFEDYLKKDDDSQAIGELLSAKKGELFPVVKKLNDDYIALKAEMSALKKSFATQLAEATAVTDKNICYFCTDTAMEDLRNFANAFMSKTDKLACAFSGSDEAGYTYVIASTTIEVSKHARTINSLLNGRGGGKGFMIMGSLKATRSDIEEKLQNVVDNI